MKYTSRNSVLETSDAISSNSRSAVTFLQRSFCLAVCLLALWRFSENSADPDLWGHVLFGQRMIRMGEIERTEPFSWTAEGHPWINHEIGAELMMGGTHLLLGGPGLLLLALTTGLFTFGMALRMGSRELNWPKKAFAWALAALLAKEIAFGFAVRPQIFTGVALITTLFALQQVHNGRYRWAFIFPVLFLAWINTHGGALAGFCILAAATAATGGQFLWKKFSREDRLNFVEVAPRLPVLLAIATVFSFGALFLNPYGTDLIRWLIGSILWFRPEIAEWNPPTLGVKHAGMFAAAAISVFAFAFSRRKRWLWEVGLVLGLAFVSMRHERHIPLFSIAALALVPPHLADAFSRFSLHFSNLLQTGRRRPVQLGLAFCLTITSLVSLVLTITYDKKRFYTIEVPGSDYPVAAIEFVRDHGIRGKMISFFDWGEQCIWELPESRVSIDGRLDTCYSRELLREHWNFFDGRSVDQTIFDFGAADFALLRTDVLGSSTLEKNLKWKVVYRDPLSVVLVRDPDQFPRLRSVAIPVMQTANVLFDRPFFPQTPSRWAEVSK